MNAFEPGDVFEGRARVHAAVSVFPVIVRLHSWMDGNAERWGGFLKTTAANADIILSEKDSPLLELGDAWHPFTAIPRPGEGHVRVIGHGSVPFGQHPGITS